MRKGFEKQLDELNVNLIKMGAMCERHITETTDALFQGDKSYVDRSHDLEEAIDKCEREIENICMGIFLKQQPVASDLRLVSAALRMISDMERIGDQCADISDMIKYTSKHNMNEYESLREMSTNAKEMVTDAVESYVRKDLKLAHRVLKQDDVVDQLFVDIKNKLIGYIGDNPDQGEFWIDVIMIAKYFERIADHATNIAEWVEYSVVGERVK
ncbi:MAG: phosphate signaling complex protein PhoU [Lachnospiraceae bacterium]|nr:phosphate signaling complex protein PhoU [Lachnospiraceae bacterium]